VTDVARTSGVLRTLASAVDLPLLARFYDEVYLPAFAHQREPRAVWDAQLTAPGAYRLFVTLAGAGLDAAATARIDGGVTCEWYPRSRCGLLTYLVVAPGARRRRASGRALLTAVRRRSRCATTRRRERRDPGGGASAR
jgi:hypothetical protein